MCPLIRQCTSVALSVDQDELKKPPTPQVVKEEIPDPRYVFSAHEDSLNPFAYPLGWPQ